MRDPSAPPLGRPGPGGCSRGARPKAAVGQRRPLRAGCSRARFEPPSSVSDVSSPRWCGGAENSAFGARASKAADSPRGKVYKRGCSSPAPPTALPHASAEQHPLLLAASPRPERLRTLRRCGGALRAARGRGSAARLCHDPGATSSGRAVANASSAAGWSRHTLF